MGNHLAVSLNKPTPLDLYAKNRNPNYKVARGGSNAQVYLFPEGVVLKVGKDERLCDEITSLYYLKKDQRIACLYPKFLGGGKLKESDPAIRSPLETKEADFIPYYEAERIDGKSLDQAYLLGNELSTKKFFHRLAHLLQAYAKAPFKGLEEAQRKSCFKEIYEDRIMGRYDDMLSRYKKIWEGRERAYDSDNLSFTFYQLLSGETVKVNGQKYRNPFLILKEMFADERIRDILSPHILSTICVHGDFTVANILNDKQAKRFKCIDYSGKLDEKTKKLKPQDPLLDFGKFLFSPAFSLFCAKKFKLTIEEYQLRYSLKNLLGESSSASRKRNKKLNKLLKVYVEFLERQTGPLKNLLAKEPHWKLRIQFVAVIQLLCDLTYREKKDLEASIVQFSRAAELLPQLHKDILAALD